MKTLAVARLMHMTPDFYGVFPCDQIPQLRGNEASFILNTDPHYEAGEHWIAVYIKGESLRFFDSFGRGINQFADPFKTIMKDFAKDYRVITDSKKVQNVFNDSCAYWTVYYVFCRTCNVFKFDHFVENTFVNESMLKAQMKYYNLI